MATKLSGIDRNWIEDSFLAFFIFGVLFIINKFVFPGAISIGIPSIGAGALSVPASIGGLGEFLIVVIVASIAEEFFFRDFMLDFFDRKLEDVFGKRRKIIIPFLIANIIQAFFFAIFHFYAYGNSLDAAGGSLISAGIFGFVMGYVRRGTQSNITNIIIHGFMNATILYGLFVIIG